MLATGPESVKYIIPWMMGDIWNAVLPVDGGYLKLSKPKVHSSEENVIFLMKNCWIVFKIYYQTVQ
jgi:hypothetical protein